MKYRNILLMILLFSFGTMLSACSVSAKNAETTSVAALSTTERSEENTAIVNGCERVLDECETQTLETILEEEWNRDAVLDLALATQDLEKLFDSGVVIKIKPHDGTMLKNSHVTTCCILLSEQEDYLIVDYEDTEEFYSVSETMKQRIISLLNPHS